MRAILLTLLMSLPLLGQTPSQPQADEMLWSLADDADVTLPQHRQLHDHYGDPTRFVKFIIRRPPALA